MRSGRLGRLDHLFAQFYQPKEAFKSISSKHTLRPLVFQLRFLMLHVSNPCSESITKLVYDRYQAHGVTLYAPLCRSFALIYRRHFRPNHVELYDISTKSWSFIQEHNLPVAYV